MSCVDICAEQDTCDQCMGTTHLEDSEKQGDFFGVWGVGVGRVQGGSVVKKTLQRFLPEGKRCVVKFQALRVINTYSVPSLS